MWRKRKLNGLKACRPVWRLRKLSGLEAKSLQVGKGRRWAGCGPDNPHAYCHLLLRVCVLHYRPFRHLYASTYLSATLLLGNIFHPILSNFSWLSKQSQRSWRYHILRANINHSMSIRALKSKYTRQAFAGILKGFQKTVDAVHCCPL